MNLNAYLARIGVDSRNLRPDLATLQQLQRSHVHAIPFENLDVQLRRAVHFDLTASYHKLVEAHRGGWCYEMNGVFGWALQQLDFEVRRISAGVMREALGDVQLGGHLCLLVQLDQPYLVDVGFGGSLLQPLPLRVGERDDAPFQVGLRELEDGYWQFLETLQGGSRFSFDFRTAAADESLLAAKCHSQQTDAASPFVQNLVAQRRVAAGHVTLRGRVLTLTSGGETERTVLQSGDELVTTLRERFALDVPEAATLWPRICARHAELFGAQSAASS